MGSTVNGIYVPDVAESGWGTSVSNNMRRLADLGVNVNAYGSDLTAAQSALDALPAGGGLVVIPPGTFSGSTGLTGTKRRVTIRGAGKGNTILNYTGAGTALAWGSTGSPVANMQLVLEDLTIQLTNTAAIGLDLIRFQDFTLKNVEVLGPGTGGTSIGLRIRGSNSGVAINSDVRSCNTGIDIETQTDLSQLTTWIGGQLTSNARAVLITEGSAHSFMGTNIAATTTSPAFYQKKGSNLELLGCYFEANATGAGSASVELGTVTVGESVDSALIQGCHFVETSVVYGVKAVRSTGAKVLNNYNGSASMTALFRAETNASQSLVWGNASAGGATPHISDGSGSVDVFGIGAGTNFRKGVVGYQFNDDLAGLTTRPLTLRAPQASVKIARFFDENGNEKGSISNGGDIVQAGVGTFHEMIENGTTDAAAGAANTGRLYVRDNGAGKTQLCVRFNTGAVQVIATEP